MRKVVFAACAVGLAVVGFGGFARANETSWAITFTASSGSDFNPAADSGAKAIAVASTLSGVQDDSSIRDTRDGVPPAGTQGAPAHASWYRPTWMRNDGTDSTAFPWAFGNDYKQPLNTAPNLVKVWPDLIVWTAPGFINHLTPGDTSDDRSVFHLLITTTTPSNTAPNSINGQPIHYILLMGRYPAGYVPGANGSTMPTAGDGTPGKPYEFQLPAVPDPSAAVGGKLLIADIILPVVGTEADNPISGTGPPSVTQTAGYRFNLAVVGSTAPPDTEIASGPDEGVYTGSDVTFTFIGVDADSQTSSLAYAVQLDGGPFSSFSAGTSATFSGLTPGQHTFCVAAKDESGNTDETPACRTFYVDGTPPDAPAVVDDGAFTDDDDLHASWSSADAETGIDEYQYAIGTSPTDPGSGYVVDWKSAGTATEATETGLTLTPNQTYYWYVKARNGADLWSSVGVSDGMQYAPAVEWPAGENGNGHFYQLVLADSGVRWNEADAIARSAGGYLVTATSAQEEAFVSDLAVAVPGAWADSQGGAKTNGPWLGGWQPYGATEPDGGWRWVTDEPFAYANWGPGQPDNSNNQQSRLILWRPGGENSPVYWADTYLGSDPDYPQGPIAKAYIIEYEPALQQVYFNGFSEGSGDGWSTAAVDTTPGTTDHPADAFLGQFANNSVSLDLTNLPTHGLLDVTVDLYVLRSWDGNASPPLGPDIWQFAVDGIPNARTTFSNFIAPADRQAFPGQFPGGSNPGRTGGAEVDALGFQYSGGGYSGILDTVYRLHYSLPHSGASLRLAFSAEGLEAAGESWGIDNVTVRVVDDATPPNAPAVTDSGVYQVVSDQLSASWSATDSESGITDYQYAIGTSPTDPGSGYVVGWTQAGTATSVTRTGLNLLNGLTYYWYVKARNGIGLWSAVGVSDGILITIPVKDTSTGHYYQLVPGWLSWTQARDAAAGMTYAGLPGHLATISTPYEWQWLTQNAGQWNPTNLTMFWLGAYQDQNAPDYSEPAGGWRWITGEVWRANAWNSGEPNNTFYNGDPEAYLSWRTVAAGPGWNDLPEYGGLSTPDFHVRGYLVEFDQPDITPPATPTVVDGGAFTTLLDRIAASWSTSDPESGIAEYQYAVGTAPTDPGSGYVVGWTSTGTQASVTNAGVSLTVGQKYFIYVRAQNGYGLWSPVGVSDGIYAVDTVRESVGAAKIADGKVAALAGVIVTSATGQLPGRVYVESVNRASGMAVLTSENLQVGQVVDVAGILTTIGGERALSEPCMVKGPVNTPLKPLAMTLRDSASRNFVYDAISGSGQRGITDLPGRTNTIGLLVGVTGRVLDIDASYVFINDGSFPGFTGVRLERTYVPADVQFGDYLQVTGISSLRQVGQVFQELIRPRSQTDVVTESRSGL